MPNQTIEPGFRIREAIEQYWGGRCSQRCPAPGPGCPACGAPPEPGCPTCDAWAEYDRLEAIVAVARQIAGARYVDYIEEEQKQLQHLIGELDSQTLPG